MRMQTNPSVPSDQGGDHLGVLVVLVLGFAAISLALDPGRYLYEAGAYLAFAGWAAVCLTIPIALVISLAIERHRPPMWAFGHLRRKGPILLGIVALFACGLAAFTTYKQGIPARVPFYADAALDGLDRLIHGTAPYHYTHALISGQFEMVLYWVYEKVWFTLWFGLFVVAALSPPSRVRAQYFWAHALVVLVIGTILALGFSSYGPIFYGILNDSTAYRALSVHFENAPAGVALNQVRDFLVDGYRSGDPMFGAGISAMPSMHVALATLNMLYLSRLSKWLIAPGIAFFLAILVGSVHFGWHYAVDGYVSFVLVCLIWIATGRLGAVASDQRLARPAGASAQSEPDLIEV